MKWKRGTANYEGFLLFAFGLAGKRYVGSL